MANDIDALDALPPQATGETLPGQAAAAAEPIQPITATDALQAANFGDQGAVDYRTLQQLNQQAPAPAAAPSAPANPAAGLNPAEPSPLLKFLTGFSTGDPTAGSQLEQNYLRQRVAAQSLQQHAQTMAITDATFLHNLKDQPINMRAAMIQAYAAKQGRDLSAAESTYIANISPDVLQHTLERAKIGDPLALEQLTSIFGGDPVKLVDANNQMKKSSADADKAVSDAVKARSAATPEALAAARAKDVLEVANRIRMLQRPPMGDEPQRLDAAGLEAAQVPVPGVPGGKMWITRPKGGATSPGGASAAAPTGAVPAAPSATPGVLNLSKLEEGKRKEAAAAAAAKEAATTTAATRSMKEQAPKVLGIINDVENDLKKIETGPWASRLQAFMTGKVGAPNPDFQTYKTDTTLLSSLIMRMHVGARGGEYFMKKFDDMIGADRQSAPNMRATLGALRKYADIVAGTKEGTELDVPVRPGELSGQSAGGTLETSGGAGPIPAAAFLAGE